MAYPTLPTAYGTDPRPVSGVSVDRAEDGTGRLRSFYVADKAGSIPLLHRITAAEKVTLDAYYAANRLLTFSYVSLADGLTRTCAFASPPEYKAMPDSRYEAKVELTQV